MSQPRKVALQYRAALSEKKSVPATNIMSAEGSGENGAMQIVAKLFAGQVPNQFSEEDLKKVFTPYGEVTDVHLLRDNLTMMPKGCGFVTFSNRVAADKAILGLHGKVTLHATKRPMVVRYSGVPPDEEQGEAKLFVGMLARETNEDAIQKMFSPYGNILEVHVLREPDGSSKGCGFVKFGNRDSANQAILALDQKHTDAGQQRPLTVKYAHNKKQKMQLQHQQQLSNPYALQMAMMGRGGMFNPLLATGLAGGGGYGGYGAPDHSNPYAAQSANPYVAIYGGAGAAMGGQGASGTVRGPPGANVFVYNVPENFSDLDLSSMFGNFGTVISASIFRDKATGISKGFGFVSYADAASAAKGIEALNGFHIGNKRLKVQLKKGEPGASSQPAKGYAPY
eukprot:g59200.t1